MFGWGECESIAFFIHFLHKLEYSLFKFKNRMSAAMLCVCVLCYTSYDKNERKKKKKMKEKTLHFTRVNSTIV